MNQDKICFTCGTYFPSHFREGICPICDDDRQYLPDEGQVWTNYEEINKNHTVHVREVTSWLYEITVVPSFAIGQRAFLFVSDQGNILWDCIPLLNDLLKSFIHAKGGIRAIAISHPHFYCNMNDWAEEFNCPIYLHELDKEWIFNPGKNIHLWNGDEKELITDVKMINIGGHFPGSSILHISAFLPKGLILCGDTFYIARNRKHISTLYSYPNHIPLKVNELIRIKEKVDHLYFDWMIGAFDYQSIQDDAEKILKDSFENMTQL